MSGGENVGKNVVKTENLFGNWRRKGSSSKSSKDRHSSL